MSDFDDAIKAADAAAMSVFGEDTDAVVTTPDGTVTPDVGVILGEEQIEPDFDELGQQTQYRRTASFLRTDIDDVPPKSTVVCDGSTYRVTRVTGKDVSMVMVELQRESTQRRHSDSQYVRND